MSMQLSETEQAYWAALKAQKQASKQTLTTAKPVRTMDDQGNPIKRKRHARLNSDGRTAASQRALERCARMVYDYDRDFDYES